METDIQKIENRIRGAGVSVSAFLKEREIPRSTWTSWKAGAERPLGRWVGVVKALEEIERSQE